MRRIDVPGWRLTGQTIVAGYALASAGSTDNPPATRRMSGNPPRNNELARSGRA
jgi:hypothetical protein